MKPSPLPDFSTAPAVVVAASGPSLTADDCELCNAQALPFIAVNASFRLAPWADMVYMGDYRTVVQYADEARRLSGFKDRIWSCNTLAAEQWQTKLVYGNPENGLSRQPGTITLGGNSGYQALHLAVTCGARRVILIGFDMMLGPNGEKHWHADHPAPLVQAMCLEEWIHKMNILAKDLQRAGVRVVNCSRRTALQCFPVHNLEAEIEACLS